MTACKRRQKRKTHHDSIQEIHIHLNVRNVTQSSVCSSTKRRAVSYNPAGDFSLAGNPNGVWSYGWSTTLGSAGNLDSSNTTAYSGISGLDGWLTTLAA